MSGIFNTGVPGHSFDVGSEFISPLSECLYGGRTNTGTHDSPSHGTPMYWGNTDNKATYPDGALERLTIEHGYTYDVGSSTSSGNVDPYLGLSIPVKILDTKPGPLDPLGADYFYYYGEQRIVLWNSDITHARIDGEGYTEISKSFINNIVIYGREFPFQGPWFPWGLVELHSITYGNAINISGEYSLRTRIRQADDSAINIKGNAVPNLNVYTGNRDGYHGQVNIAANVTNLNIYPSMSQWGEDVQLCGSYWRRNGCTVENTKLHAYNPMFGVTGNAHNPNLCVQTKATFDNVIMDMGQIEIDDDMPDNSTVTIIDGEMNGISTLNTRAENNPYYEGFLIGLDKTQSDEGMLVNSEDATILFSTGMHVLAGHYTGSTGTDESFAKVTPGQSPP